MSEPPATSAAAGRASIEVPSIPFAHRAFLALLRATEVALFRPQRFGALRLAHASRLSKHRPLLALAVARSVAEDPRATLAAHAADYIELAIRMARFDRDEAKRIAARLDDTKLAKPMRAATARMRARFARHDGDFAAMLRFADAAVAMQATSPSFFARAIALKNLGRIEEAIRAIEEALHRGPNDAVAHLARAGYGVIAGEADAANRVRAVIADELLHRSDETTWLLNVAWAQALLGDDDAVFASLRAAAASNSPNATKHVREYVDVEADFARLRDDPRMIALKRDLT